MSSPPTTFRPEDLPVLFRDMGVPVVYQGRTFLGLFDQADITIVDDRGNAKVIGNENTVTVRVDDMPNSRLDELVNVAGVDYSIRDHRHTSDTALICFVLGAVTPPPPSPGPGPPTWKQYVDQQDAATLAEANAYTDTKVGAIDLDSLTDVDIATPSTDGDVLTFNATTGLWENRSLPPGGVTSVFGRSGDVVAQFDDYAAVDNVVVQDSLGNGMIVDTTLQSVELYGDHSVTVDARNGSLNLSDGSGGGADFQLQGTGAGIYASGSELYVNGNAHFNGSSVVRTNHPANSDDSFQVATTHYVKDQIAALPGNRWSDLQDGINDLILANGITNTWFNQTFAVTWKWANITPATSGVSQSSPLLTLSGMYWTGSATSEDRWTIQNLLANGANAASTLTFTHAGSTGLASLSIPNGIQFTGTGPNIIGTKFGLFQAQACSNSALALYCNTTFTNLFYMFWGVNQCYGFTTTDFSVINAVAATLSLSQSSPTQHMRGTYWTGSASATDDWTIQSVIANGANGASTLTFAHTGTTGAAQVQFPAGSASAPSLVFGGSGNANGLFNWSSVGVGVNTTGGQFILTKTGSSMGLLLGDASTYFNITSTTGGMQLVLSGISTTQVGACVAISNRGSGGLSGASGAQTLLNIGSSQNSGTGTFAPTSGSATFTCVNINPTINQTGGANGNYTGLRVNVVETALGGSTNLLLDLQAGVTGGVSKFSVNNSGTIQASGGITLAFASKSANYTLTASDFAVAFSATATATLPTGMPTGKMFRLKNTGASATLTISPASGNIDGSASRTLNTQYQSVDVVFDGTNWLVY